MTRRFILLFAAFIFLAGCSLPAGTGPQAWIDAPLDGSRLPLAPTTIVFHAFSAGNPKAVELTLNGQAVTPDPIQLERPLVTLSYLWSPERPGRYVIVARTQDQDGTWSEPHTHVVEIGEPTVTPVITITPTPTTTPTVTPLAGPIFSGLSLSTNLFYRLDSIPTRVTFTIQVNDPAGIKSVDFYFRLRDPGTGDTTAWGNLGMGSIGGGRYTCTLASSNPALAPVTPQTMTLEYQFVVTHPDQSLARSPVYNDVALKKTY